MKISSSTKIFSSVPIGGVGTGSISIDPLGVFDGWTIFNNKPWSDYGEPEKILGRDDLVFILRVKKIDKDPILLILRTEPWFSRRNYDPYSSVNDALNPYQTPWVRNVEYIEFSATPPKVSLEYRDVFLEKNMLSVSLDIYSPIIPGDLETSSTPIIILRFRFKSQCKYRLELSLLGILRNPFTSIRGVRASNKRVSGEEFVGVEMSGDGLSDRHGMFNGSLALIGVGKDFEASSFVLELGDRFRYTDPLRRLLVEFRREGRLTSETDKIVYVDNLGLFGAVSKTIILEPGEEKEIIYVLAWYFPNHIDRYGNRLGHYYENKYSDLRDLLNKTINKVGDIISRVDKVLEKIYDVSYEKFLVDLALSQLPTLTKSTWLTKDGFFAIWEGGPGTCAGLNTVDVMYYALPTILLMYPDLGKRIVIDWTNHLLSPDKSPHYEVFALSYPENMFLYREALRKDPSIQHVETKFRDTLKRIISETGKDPSGRVMHCYTASPYHVDTYDRNDLMPEYILQVILATHMTGDKEFFEKLVDKIDLVIESTLRQHDDAKLRLIYHTPPSGYEGFSQVAKKLYGKGLSDEVIRVLLSGPMFYPVAVNTFDNLSFHGIASFTADLWVSSLKAYRDTLEILGLSDKVPKINELYETARENYIKYLWNGEYFDNWFDPLTGYRDKAIMSAVFSGQWYLKQLMGLEYSIDKRYVVETLKKIYMMNYREFEGLLNATYPSGRRPGLEGDLLYENETGIPYLVGGQPDTPWTGIEIPVALTMMWEGMTHEGLSVLRNVHERYMSWGMYWNHMECDGHYMRALVSLQILNHLAGIVINGLTKTLHIDPKHPRERFRGAVLLPSSLAHLTYESSREKLEATIQGVLGASTVSFNKVIIRSEQEPVSITVLYNDQAETFKYSYDKERRYVYINLSRNISLKEGDSLKILIKYG